MKKFAALLVYLTLSNAFQSQNPWANPCYDLHDLILYSGSGASARHMEKNYFNGKYDYYLKSPFVSFGFDYCFARNEALWGVGLYFSGAAGKKNYAVPAGDIGKLWSDYMGAIKFTHHSMFFNRRKIDLCSGYIIGVRSKNYERVFINGDRRFSDSGRNFDIAAGISLTARYYPFDLWAIYAEGALGYNVDVFQFGIAKRFKNKGKSIKHR